MLTNDQEYIICLIRRAFRMDGGKQICQIENISEVKNMVLRNGLLPSVYPTIKADEIAGDLKRLLESDYYALISQSVCQDLEGGEVLNELNAFGFDCIALKGWELRNLYPNPYMRQMVDVDILVRPYDFKRIKDIMQQLGFSGDAESSWKHDNFKKQNIKIEIHKRLTDDSGVIMQWEERMWERAISNSGHIFKMTPEDFYIFHFVHLYKDFLNGSLGLRRIIDTWLLQKQSIDMLFVNNTLKNMRMDLFHDRICKLSRVLMGDEMMDENSEILLSHSFLNGVYGTSKSYKTGRITAMSRGQGMTSGKLKSWLAAVFLPYSRMKAQFPVLKKWPILLPYYWLVRINRFLHSNLSKSKQKLDYSRVSEDDYQEMIRFFNAGGVF